MRRAYYEVRSSIQYYRNAKTRRQRLGSEREVRFSQAPLAWAVSFPSFETFEVLKAYVRDAGLDFAEGAHTVYLPPQPGLEAILGDAVLFYPPDAGFKILKNFGTAESTPYLEKEFAKNYAVLNKMTGSVHDVFRRSMTFNLLGFGPPVYDLVTLTSETQRFSCLVVQHVTGRVPASSEREAYIARLRKAAEEKLITFAVPEGLNHVDFTDVEKDNLIYDTKEEMVQMIDAQSIIPVDSKTLVDHLLHEGKSELEFGRHWQWRKGEYVYQSLPGLHGTSKRDTEFRWVHMMELLAESGHSLKGRMVLDICCNAGMMLAMALSEGAKWGLGWDLPEVVEHSSKLHKVLGFSRTTLTGAPLSATYNLTQDIPARFVPHLDGACVFFLAAVRHVGWVDSIKDIPWKMLFFEGHESVTPEENKDTLYAMAEQWNAKVVAFSSISDGDSHPRALALLIRED